MLDACPTELPKSSSIAVSSSIAMSQTYSALSAAFNSPSVSYKDQEAGVVHEVFFWHYIFSTVEPPYPYALAQLGNS